MKDFMQHHNPGPGRAPKVTWSGAVVHHDAAAAPTSAQPDWSQDFAPRREEEKKPASGRPDWMKDFES
jgi:hypothetical protein